MTHKDVGNGEVGETVVRYVVGADGGRSFVRKYIGTGMEELAKSQIWMIVDIVGRAGSDR